MKMVLRLVGGNEINMEFDTSDMKNKVEFDSSSESFKNCWDVWGEKEAVGFFQHLANSIRKRCRDFSWHLKPTSFSFQHGFIDKGLGSTAGTVSVVKD